MKPIIPFEHKDKNKEIVYHLREYLSVIRDEPANDKMLMYKLYHDLNRILGNEV